MRIRVQKGLTVLLLAALVGCTTMQEVKPQEGSLIGHLEIGERIIVYEKTGRIVDMRFVLIEGDVLRGSLNFDGLEPVEIRLDEIEKIEAERVAAGRTTAAILGGIILAPIAAVGAGVALAE